MPEARWLCESLEPRGLATDHLCFGLLVIRQWECGVEEAAVMVADSQIEATGRVVPDLQGEERGEVVPESRILCRKK
jgi:hypothetical protein